SPMLVPPSSRACGGLKNFARSSGAENVLNVKFVSNHRLQWTGYTATVCASYPPSTTTTTTTTSTTTTSTTTTTTDPPVMCDDICGSVAGFTGRISNPTPAATTIPWVVVVDILRDNLYIRASGILISRKHVLTSAFIFFQATPTGYTFSTTFRYKVFFVFSGISSAPRSDIKFSFRVFRYIFGATFRYKVFFVFSGISSAPRSDIKFSSCFQVYLWRHLQI
ncbi:uncharacterized protein LOC122248630, partial [Penaeus japonicus]|uniref:uncharacterized protein LOC122248630 n=1 Tax=Penaeus japonicus TaxID=27405 RepID=UPI001C71661A